MNQEVENLLDVEASIPAAPESNMLMQYAKILSEPDDETQGTFVIPSIDKHVIRLYDSKYWESPTKPRGFIRVVTRYTTLGGDLGNELSVKQNSILFPGTVSALKMLLGKWSSEGRIDGIVAHLEYTQEELEANGRLQAIYDKGKMSIKQIPAKDGMPAQDLLYNGGKGYMFQAFREVNFSAETARKLSKRLGADDASAERYHKNKEERIAAVERADKLFQANEAQERKESEELIKVNTAKIAARAAELAASAESAS